MMESRLAPVARREGYDSIADLIAAIRSRREDSLIWATVEAMAGGDTSFYRDREPFHQFREEIAPQLLRSRGGAPIKVWSAACAAAPEGHSLGLTVGDSRGA